MKEVSCLQVCLETSTSKDSFAKGLKKIVESQCFIFIHNHLSYIFLTYHSIYSLNLGRGSIKEITHTHAPFTLIWTFGGLNYFHTQIN